MKLWLASTDPDRVVRWFETGMFAGILTNPATLAAAERPALDTITDLCRATSQPVFFQLKDGSVDAMKRQATMLLDQGLPNLGIKAAVTPSGLAVLGWLREQKVALRVATAVTGVVPLLLAAGLEVPWVTPSGSALEKKGGPTKLELMTQMQTLLERQQAVTTLIPSLSSPGEMATLAGVGVGAGFLWDKDVERFLKDPLVQETSDSFASAWAHLESLEDQPA